MLLYREYSRYYLTLKLLFTLLALIIVTFITIMSSLTGRESGNGSTEIVATITQSFINAFNIEVTEEYFAKIVGILNLLARKAMHMSEFAVLAMCFAYAFEHNRHYIQIAGISAVVCAGMDEIHQTFVEGRAGIYTDVLIDSLGIIIALAVIWLLSRFVYTYRDKCLFIQHNGYMIK